jgi:hypothetical protein
MAGPGATTPTTPEAGRRGSRANAALLGPPLATPTVAPKSEVPPSRIPRPRPRPRLGLLRRGHPARRRRGQRTVPHMQTPSPTMGSIQASAADLGTSEPLAVPQCWRSRHACTNVTDRKQRCVPTTDYDLPRPRLIYTRHFPQKSVVARGARRPGSCPWAAARGRFADFRHARSPTACASGCIGLGGGARC